MVEIKIQLGHFGNKTHQLKNSIFKNDKNFKKSKFQKPD